jgi:hypothetical protein
VFPRQTTTHDSGGHFQYLTIQYSEEYDDDESTGLSFSPNGKFMYVTYRDHGLCFLLLFLSTKNIGRSAFLLLAIVAVYVPHNTTSTNDL